MPAQVGSSCNDGLIDGLFALNLNDAPSNSNWNVGGGLLYLKVFSRPFAANAVHKPQHLLKISR